MHIWHNTCHEFMSVLLDLRVVTKAEVDKMIETRTVKTWEVKKTGVVWTYEATFGDALQHN